MRSLWLGAACATFVTACTDSTDPEAAAETAMFSAMNAGDLDAGATAAGDLQVLYDKDPSVARTTFLLGAVHNWRVAEAPRDPARANAIRTTEGPLEFQYEMEAFGLEPTNGFFAAFFGLNVHDEGLRENNPQMVGQGRALIDMAVQLDPIVGGFVKMLASQELAPDDPLLAQDVDAGVHVWEVCLGIAIDREHPDVRGSLAKLGDAPPHCAASAKVPHAVEGNFLYIADEYVKLGRVDVAKAWYANAQATPSYASWPHRDAVEGRLASDLDARAAAYRGDPSTWPAIGDPPYACTTCHGATAK